MRCELVFQEMHYEIGAPPENGNKPGSGVFNFGILLKITNILKLKLNLIYDGDAS